MIARDALTLLSWTEPEPDLSGDVSERIRVLSDELYHTDMGDMIVTPREIDELAVDVASVLASGINQALQPNLSEPEIAELTCRG